MIPNNAAQEERFTIPTNMRVPATSVMSRQFEADTHTESDGQENLSKWESKGNALEGRAFVVVARKVSDSVIAMAQSAEAARVRKRQESKSKFFG